MHHFLEFYKNFSCHTTNSLSSLWRLCAMLLSAVSLPSHPATTWHNPEGTVDMASVGGLREKEHHTPASLLVPSVSSALSCLQAFTLAVSSAWNAFPFPLPCLAPLLPSFPPKMSPPPKGLPDHSVWSMCSFLHSLPLFILSHIALPSLLHRIELHFKLNDCLLPASPLDYEFCEL